MLTIDQESASTIKNRRMSTTNNGVAQLQPESICEEETDDD
jgi:hypothetical protein